jgi:hypothetical protein
VAQRVLDDHLSGVRAHSQHEEIAYGVEPAFSIETVLLDRPKVITSHFTR